MIGAGEKIGKMVDLAEELYRRVSALQEQLQSTTETVEETAERVERLETQVAEQRELLEAIAEDHGVDVSAVTGSAVEAAPGGDEGE